MLGKKSGNIMFGGVDVAKYAGSLTTFTSNGTSTVSDFLVTPGGPIGATLLEISGLFVTKPGGSRDFLNFSTNIVINALVDPDNR